MHTLAFIACLALHIGLIAIFARAMAPPIWSPHRPDPRN